MKDKLYKTHKTKRSFIFKKIIICSAIAFASSIVAAIPLSINLVQETKANKESISLKEISSNEEKEDNIILPEKTIILI